MKHLFEAWPDLAPMIAARRLLLFLDYDGTLTPIVERPERSFLNAATRRALRVLAARRDCSVVIISGRTLKAIKDQVKLPGLIYAGNHGLDIDGPDLKRRATAPSATRRAMGKIRDRLLAQQGEFSGALFEDKGLTLSLHYRLCRPRTARDLIQRAGKIIRPFVKAGQVRVLSGKKVIEIFPPRVKGKGGAALWIRQMERRRLGSGLLTIAAGDDTTDEDIFSVLRGDAVTVVVGRRERSQARYYLQGPQEVRALLERITVVKKAKPLPAVCQKKRCSRKKGNGKIKHDLD